MQPHLLSAMSHGTSATRPARTAHSNLPYMSSGHISSSQWGGSLQADFHTNQELTTTLQAKRLEPITEADVKFLALTDNTATNYQNYGLVSAGPPPFNLYGTVDTAEVGEKFTAVLQTLNFNDQPCYVPMNSVNCELVSAITGTRVKGRAGRWW